MKTRRLVLDGRKFPRPARSVYTFERAGGVALAWQQPEAGDAVSIKAPAKINLFLRVRPGREHGLHRLITVFQSLELADRLTVRRHRCHHRCQTVIQCAHPGVPTDHDNTVARAVELLSQNVEKVKHDGMKRCGWQIELQKHIPVASGLGGGSSDAGSVLRVLNDRCDLGLSPAKLNRLAAEVGADVPYFLTGGTVLAAGAGDELEPVTALPSLGVVLLVPPFEVSSGDAYRWFDQDGPVQTWDPARARSDARQLLDLLRHKDLGGAEKYMVNDLAAGVIRRRPAVKKLIDLARQAGAGAVQMTGSGPVVFALARSLAEAEALRQRIETMERPPGSRLLVTRLQGRWTHGGSKDGSEEHGNGDV